MIENLADEIVQLDFPECVRTRPGMYIGELTNPDVIYREVIDNSIDELFASEKSDKLFIDNQKEFYIVADNGRGIPIHMDKEKGITKTHLAFSALHTSSKFNKKDVAIGMNGVGASCTNALSSEFHVLSKITISNFYSSIPLVKEQWTSRSSDESEELYYWIKFNKGSYEFETVTTIKNLNESLGLNLPDSYSTYTFFVPDNGIFSSIKAKVPKLNLSYSKLILDKFYNRKVDFKVNGELIESDLQLYKYTFCEYIQLDDKSVNSKVGILCSFELDTDLTKRDYSGSVNSLVVNRGVHIQGLEGLFARTLKSRFGISHNKITEGLKMFVVLLTGEVNFSSQTKERLTGVPGLNQSQFDKLSNQFVKIMKDNHEYFETHVERLNQFAASVANIAIIDKIKAMVNISADSGSKSRSNLPSKVFDCTTKNRKDAELFIVEG